MKTPAPAGHNKGGFAGEKLRQYVAQLEQLEIEKGQLNEHIKDVYTVARSTGFDTKIIRAVLKLRKLDTAKRQEAEELLDTYLHALGMIPDFEAENEKP